MAKVLVGISAGEGRDAVEPEEEGTEVTSPPFLHSLWVKFSGKTPFAAFSLFCCQSSCFIPISQPSS